MFIWKLDSQNSSSRQKPSPFLSCLRFAGGCHTPVHLSMYHIFCFIGWNKCAVHGAWISKTGFQSSAYTCTSALSTELVKPWDTQRTMNPRPFACEFTRPSRRDLHVKNPGCVLQGITFSYAKQDGPPLSASVTLPCCENAFHSAHIQCNFEYTRLSTSTDDDAFKGTLHWKIQFHWWDLFTEKAGAANEVCSSVPYIDNTLSMALFILSLQFTLGTADCKNTHPGGNWLLLLSISHATASQLVTWGPCKLVLCSAKGEFNVILPKENWALSETSLSYIVSERTFSWKWDCSGSAFCRLLGFSFVAFRTVHSRNER